jgi:hypothetical protein
VNQAFVIEPFAFVPFEREDELIGKCKEWGLLSEKAAKAKSFLYKRNGESFTCRIVGYVDDCTAVIEFEDGRKHCIHPAYLKEMQASTFGRRSAAASDEQAADESADPVAGEGAQLPEGDRKAARTLPEDAAAKMQSPSGDDRPEAKTIGQPESPAEDAAPPKPAAKKGRAPKLELPEEKVKMTAVVKEFTTVPNHFADTDDEVVVYESVAIVEPPLVIGEAWSSYSATLQKLGLQVGDRLAFEAKIVAKKLTKHPVPYKINNPSKLQKQ